MDRYGTRATPVRVLGLDIGGSTTRALLDVDGGAVAEATGPSASLTAAGPAVAHEVFDVVLDRLAERAGGAIGPLDAVCAGTAGSGAGGADDWIADRLRLALGARMGAGLHARDVPVAIVNDAVLVLAAEELASGIALVAGTGSIALGVFGDREVRAGGWGWLLGDEGGGYWIVREAVRELCRRHESGEEPGTWTGVLGGAPVPDLVRRFHEEPAPAGWAAFAPGVLESADPAVAAIAEAGARSLAGLVAAVAASLDHPPPVPVVLAGGLVNRPGPYADAVVRAIGDVVASADVRTARHPPVRGAVRLAQGMVVSEGR